MKSILWCVILFLALLGGSLFADTREADVHTFVLTYTTEGVSADFHLDLQERELRFKNEPDYEGRNIVRGLIPLSPDQQDYIAFACDMDARTLYVDLNRNLDLTDDPEGVFHDTESGWRRRFSDIVVPIEQNGRQRELVIDFTLYGSRWGNYTVKSSWHADELMIGGQPYSLSVIDDGDGVITDADTLSITALQADSGPATLDAPNLLVLDGAAYDLSYQISDDGQTMRLKVEPSQTELFNVELSGENIQRLVLQSHPSAALFHTPSRSIQVPRGSYRAEVLVQDTHGPQPITWQSRRVPLRLRAGDDSTVWSIGGPVTHRLTHTMTAGRITFHYKAQGAGGEDYTGARRQVGNPQLRIEKDGIPIHVGQFEYG